MKTKSISQRRKKSVFMKRNLKMMDEQDEQVETIDFQRAHRFGGRTEGRPRPIVAMLPHYEMKIAFLQQGRELKNSPFSINEQFPHEIVERRRALYPTFKRLWAEKQNVCLVVDKLYVNNQ